MTRSDAHGRKLAALSATGKGDRRLLPERRFGRLAPKAPARFSLSPVPFSLSPLLISLALAGVMLLAGWWSAAQAGVISHWTFDSDFNDQTSANNLSTGAGTPALSTADSRFGGAALSLDGASWLTTANWSLGGSYTVATWVKPSNIAVDWAGFFNKQLNNGQRVFWFGQQSTDGRIRFGNYYNNTGESPLDAGFSIANGQWTHLAASWDDTTDTQTVYVNGRVVAQVVRTGTNQPAGNDPLWVGRSTANNYTGLMDEAWIFDQALSADQVSRLTYSNNIAGAAENRSVIQTWDFESGNLSGWTPLASGVPGDNLVFTTAGNMPTARPTVGFEENTVQGNYFIRTWEGEVLGTSDAHTGIIESAPFVLGPGARFDFMVGGGYHPFGAGNPNSPPADVTAFNLEREVSPGNWQVAFTATGYNGNFLSPARWDASAYDGETMRLRIYDTSTGGWGHIDVDNIVRSEAGPQMIAQWNFDDGTANDSADAHNGTFVDNATTVPGGLGGRALSLDGSGDYVDAGRWGLGGKFTISAWINPDNVAADWTGFLSKNSIAGQNVFWFGQHANDGWVRFGNYLDGSNTETFVDSGTVAIGNGKWQHVVATYDGHFQKIYVNGNLVAVSADRNALQMTGDAPLYIGRIQVVSNCFDGLMDEVRIHNYALDQSGVVGMMGPVIAQFGALEWNKPAAGTSSWGYTAIDGTGKLRMDVPGGQDIWTTRGLAPALLTAPPAGDYAFETRVTTDNQMNTIAGLVIYDDAAGNFAYNYGWARDGAFGGGAEPPYAAMYRPGVQMYGGVLNQDNAILRMEKVGNSVTPLYKLAAADPYWHSLPPVDISSLSNYRIGLLSKTWTGNTLRADFDYLNVEPGFVPPAPVTDDPFDTPLPGWRLNSPGNSTVDLSTAPGKLHMVVPGGNDLWVARGTAPLLVTPGPSGDFGFQTHVDTDRVLYSIAGLMVYNNAAANYAYSVAWAADPNEGGSDVNPQVSMNSSIPGQERLGARFINQQDNVILRMEKMGSVWSGLYKLNDSDPYWRGVNTRNNPGLTDYQIGLFGKTWTANGFQADFDYFRVVAPRPPVATDFFGDASGQEGWTWDSPAMATYDLTSRAGSLHFNVPVNYDMWTARNNAPILYSLPWRNPEGVFSAETHVEVDNPNGNVAAGLVVIDLDDNDGNNFDLSWGWTQWGGGYDIRLESPGVQYDFDNRPLLADNDVYLKLLYDAPEEKWHAFWKSLADDPWSEFGSGFTVPGITNPRIGLFTKTGPNGGQSADVYFDYFAAVPEPSTLLLLCLGLTGLAAWAGRRRRPPARQS